MKIKKKKKGRKERGIVDSLEKATFSSFVEFNVTFLFFFFGYFQLFHSPKKKLHKLYNNNNINEN